MKTNLDIHVVHHCNLNCTSCAHLAPIADKSFMLTAKQIDEDLSKIDSKIFTRYNRVVLLGGEPLLNHEIADIVTIVRKYLPVQTLYVQTNALLLEKMPDSFWASIRDNEAEVFITKYNIGLDYDKFVRLGQSKNVSILFANKVSPVYFVKYPYDLTGRQDYISNFNSCIYTTEYDCTQLIGTKIYYCPQCAFMTIFNRRFGTSLNAEDSCLDLSKASIDEVEGWYATPKRCCSYCNLKNKSVVNWGISKKEITEWT